MHSNGGYAPAVVNAVLVILIIVAFEDVRYEPRNAVLFISIIEFSCCADWGRIDSTNPKSDTLPVAQPIMLAAESFVPWQYTVGDFRISWQGESIRSAHTIHTESRGSSVAVLK